MPQPQLTKPERGLYEMTLTVTHNAYVLDPTVTAELVLRWTDDTRATVMRFDVADGDMGDLPREVSDIVDGFLWGEGAKQVIAVVQRLDRKRQSRRAQQQALTL